MPMFNNNYGYGAYNPQQNYQGMLQQQQVQTNGLISVRNETEARNYPLAPGNSITFKDENGPYVYVKTMGMSQFDQPTFEKFRLVKEEAEAAQPVSQAEYALKSEFDALKAEVAALKEGKSE